MFKKYVRDLNRHLTQEDILMANPTYEKLINSIINVLRE